MAPLSLIYPRTPAPIAAMYTSIQNRSSNCSNYDQACDDSRHFIFLVIILLLGFFFTLVFTFLHFRSRKARILYEARVRLERDQMHIQDSTKPSEEAEWQTPPPPYMPARPASVARIGR